MNYEDAFAEPPRIARYSRARDNPETRARKLNDALWKLPIDNPERNKLPDVIKGTPEQLASKAAKYLTLASEYTARRRKPHLLEFDGQGVYAKWLSSCGISPRDVRAIVALPTHPTPAIVLNPIDVWAESAAA